VSPLADLLTLDDLAERFTAAARALYPESDPKVAFEAPRRVEFGDIATNVAFGLAKAAKAPPPAIASAIAEHVMADASVRATVLEATPAAGFINLKLTPAYWHNVLATILREGADYGRGPARGEQISLEFGSANPTGPLVVVQGRTLSIGDTLAKAMRFAGYDVFTEWIINDAGSQVDTLGRSLYARYRQLWEPAFPFPEEGYPGDYLLPVAEALRARDGERWRTASEADWLPAMREFGRDTLVAEQRVVAEKFGVAYDLWQSEKEMNERGAVEAGLERLRAMGLTYEEDGATWVKTSDFGDDQDRVVIRSDGRPTYYAADVAYFYEKFERGNQRAYIILGPDHHGYIGRLHALAAAYGHPGGIDVIIAQQITLMRGTEVVSMSKRAGQIVTLQDIIDEVGVDAARFFFVMLSTDQPLTFDLALAKEQSNDNPVFSVQYGHARIASLVRRALERDAKLASDARTSANLARLTGEAELALLRRLSEFGAVIEGVARTRAPHRLPKYARDIATDFHRFYDSSPVLPVLESDRELAVARLALAIAAQTVLAQALHLCGVSAPEQMSREIADPA
jgi:arginyl-tRNA synthetase